MHTFFYHKQNQNCGRGSFVRLVGVVTWLNKLALSRCLQNLYAESLPSSLYSS